MRKVRKIILSLVLVLTIFVGSFSPALAKSDYYKNVNQNKVHVPVKSIQAPKRATGKCRDGSYTFALNHRGACSHHGGVFKWIK